LFQRPLDNRQVKKGPGTVLTEKLQTERKTQEGLLRTTALDLALRRETTDKKQNAAMTRKRKNQLGRSEPRAKRSTKHGEQDREKNGKKWESRGQSLRCGGKKRKLTLPISTSYLGQKALCMGGALEKKVHKRRIRKKRSR